MCTKAIFFLPDPEAPYSWSEEEIADLLDHCSVIMAADGREIQTVSFSIKRSNIMSNNLNIPSLLLKSNRSDPYLICLCSALSVPACIFLF